MRPPLVRLNIYAYFMHIINFKIFYLLLLLMYLLFMRVAIFPVSAKNYAHLLKNIVCVCEEFCTQSTNYDELLKNNIPSSL